MIIVKNILNCTEIITTTLLANNLYFSNCINKIKLKMMIQKISKFILIIMTMVVSFLSYGQTKSLPVYVITPEINKKIIENNPSLFDVHHIKTDKIKYLTYEPAEFKTYEYDKQEKIVANFELFKFKVFSWGKIIPLELTPDMFSTNFYGYVYGK